ncbi:MAG: hypothetical protein ABIA93_04005 [Candidatus Woesearchaeota archaeon]
MESVTIKLDNALLRRMGSSMAVQGYSTKTEFIREAIRDKLDSDDREKLIKEFMKFRGKAKVKTTYAENRKVREEVGREIMREFDVKFK